MPQGDGPFQIIERINDKAYKVDLPGEYGVSAQFNVANLSLFDVGEDLSRILLRREGMMRSKHQRIHWRFRLV